VRFIRIDLPYRIRGRLTSGRMRDLQKRTLFLIVGAAAEYQRLPRISAGRRSSASMIFRAAKASLAA
jgi:hypothetical protein